MTENAEEKCSLVAEEKEKDRFPIGQKKPRESGNKRSTVDGYPKRQVERVELCGDRKKYHIDPRTAKRYAESPQKPKYTLSASTPAKMNPYKQIVDEWLKEAPYSAVRILEKLREILCM